MVALERQTEEGCLMLHQRYGIHSRLKNIQAIITVWKIAVHNIVVNKGILVLFPLGGKVSWLQYFV